ncbi:MAG: response regulator [Gammaproteobacteria bacterium]|nr:response regulator [Gammaproteobacteria bacterium]
MKIVLYTLIILLTISCFEAIAQQHQLEKIEIDLSHNSIYATIQDQAGYLWFATPNGVNRYDGQQVRVYGSDPDLDCSLPNGEVKSLLETTNGDIWAGTANGLARYSRTQDCFYSYLHQQIAPLSHSNNVEVLFEDNLGRIWTAGSYLMVFDPQTNKYTQISDAPDDVGHRLDKNAVTARANPGYKAIYQDPQGTIWVVGINGLARVDQITNKITQVYSRAPHQQWHQKNSINSILPADEQQLWLGTDDGLLLVNKHGQLIKHYQLSSNTSRLGIFGNIVASLYYDNKGNLWVGSFNGVYRYQRSSDTFIPYLRTQALHSKQRSNITVNFITDHQGLLWVGMAKGVYLYNQTTDKFYSQHNTRASEQSLIRTNDGNKFKLFLTRSGTILASIMPKGLYKITQNKITFNHYRHLTTSDNYYGNKITRAIYEDPLFMGNVVWFGLDGGGVKRIEFSTNAAGHRVTSNVKHYRQKTDSDSFTGESIYDIQRDSRGRLWLATDCGLRQWSDHKQDFIVLESETLLPTIDGQASVCDTQILNLLSDIKGEKLWFGGDNRLGYLDLTTADSVPVWLTASNYSQLKDNIIYNIYQDHAGLLWLATSNGLILFNSKTATMRQFQHQSDDPNSLSLNWVQGITEMPVGTYWVATRGGGLNKLTFNQQQQPIWQTFDQSHGLADNFLYAILSDKQGNLWFSSNQGITRFNTLNYQSRNITSKDGLQDYDYGGAHIGDSGQFYFGGINGFNTFRPELVSTNQIAPKLSLRELRINDHPINPSSVNQLSLSYQQNYLSFDYVGLHFDNPDSIRYQYFVKGIDQNWRDATSNQKIRYSDIASGQYEFYIKASNADGVWSEAKLLTSFSISSRPSRSNWAYGLYVLLIALLVLSYRKGRNCYDRILEQSIDQATFSLARANENIRLQFQSFAHEVKTPLMSVGNYCKLAIDQINKITDDQDIKLILNYLTQVDDSLNDIRQVVKQELDNAELRITTNNGFLHILVRPAVEYCVATRQNRIDEKSLVLKIDIVDNPVIYAQVGVLELMLGNLLDNAIQYTPKGGTIVLKIRAMDTDIEFTVKDNGPGISTLDYYRIFLHGYRGDSLEHTDNRGMGLFLVKNSLENNSGTIELMSDLGQGACFRVELPRGKYSQAQPLMLRPSLDMARDVVTLLPEDVTFSNDHQQKILIIEDNDQIRHSLIQILNEQHQCISASSAVEGLKLSQTQLPDLIITDIKMEQSNSGIELTKKLKGHSSTAHIPVIICSALNDDSTRMQAIAAQADLWLDKMVKVEIFQAHVNTLLSQHARIRSRIKQDLNQVQTHMVDPEVEVEEKQSPQDEAYDNSQQQRFIATVKAVICERYLDETINVETMIARHFNGSIRTFQYKAKKYLPGGLTMKQCVNGYRGLQALKLLQQTDKPIKAIYAEAGFTNERQMSRWFDKYLEQTPTDYREGKRADNSSQQIKVLENFFN